MERFFDPAKVSNIAIPEYQVGGRRTDTPDEPAVKANIDFPK